MYDYLWLCMTMDDYMRLSMTMYDYVCLCMPKYDYVWLYMTIYRGGYNIYTGFKYNELILFAPYIAW